MLRVLIALCLLATTWNVANGECANACNGHGKCTSYDMCICNRNWQAADCSERVCQFGLAHVDTPKGDLDGSGTVTNANEIVIENNYVYPYGTTEQFPQMQNTDLETLSDTAHYYMECSNKGRCDRTSGECQCFDGYDGVACQRASCPGYPNSCSGHGVCKSIGQLAALDHANVYELWDKNVTMGCSCDAGYFGPDCSQRQCKVGVDPLYLDDAATIKYPTWNVAILSTRANATSFSQLFSDGEYQTEPGHWALHIYDSYGEDWLTQPIVAGATCSQVVAALEEIPNDVIPAGSIDCTLVAFLNGTENTFTEGNKAYYDSTYPTYKLHYKMAVWEAQTGPLYGELSQYTPIVITNSSTDLQTTKLSGYIYQLKFNGNPGALPQPKVEVYLDGKRPTLISLNSKVITKVWTDGQQGEYNDYFADYCDGVTVTIGYGTGLYAGQSFLTGFSVAEKNLLKKCLGSSDFNITNNQDVYNWDKGNKYYPHIIKLVRTVTTYNDGGYYAITWYDTSNTFDNTAQDGTFWLLNPFQEPNVVSPSLQTDNYNVYTTQGVLGITSTESELTVGYASKYFFTVNATYDIWRTDATSTEFYDGDLSCEVGANNGYHLNYIYNGGANCLNKNDIFTFINWEYPALNPPHINLYTAERLWTGPFEYTANARFYSPTNSHTSSNEMHFQTHMITADISSNWGVSIGPANPGSLISGVPHYHIYKFFPAAASTYNYVAECSNRGICDRDTGTCKCFPGYTSDACDSQSSLAV